MVAISKTIMTIRIMIIVSVLVLTVYKLQPLANKKKYGICRIYLRIPFYLIGHPKQKNTARKPYFKCIKILKNYGTTLMFVNVPLTLVIPPTAVPVARKVPDIFPFAFAVMITLPASAVK